ncbi:hypothetical protein [Aureispira sp. CCB-E]|uniref:hypothetical protein n=1 Tax=Aureispira sp. CCB-E TaxID=3051121 RepID=UPI002868AF28|nr:hypothetical protein [Aureispira sp. CCB-E]WMX15961.1 hypothetical protein QP953_06240 [Aureispira sp. CCB-E]
MKVNIKNILIVLSVSFLWSCGEDYSTIDKNVTFPKAVVQPDGVRFDYLMYDNDYNWVPQNGDPTEYGNEHKQSESSGLYFKLSNKRAFGPGVDATVQGEKEGEWYRISFACMKPSKVIVKPEDVKGILVVSFERGDSVLNYTTYPIQDLLKEQNKQFVDKWETLSVWYEVPKEVQEGDRLKIYPWNPVGGDLYLDDFTVETWTTKALKPEGVIWSHIVTEQNYETSDLAGQTTKETAARGLFSCVLSSQEGRAQYGKGYSGTLASAKIQPGDYVKVAFAGLKKHHVRQVAKSANMVISLERDGKQLFWEGLAIDPRLKKGDRQAYGKWVNLVMWKQIPEDAKETDVLKIYPWNNNLDPIYIDDLQIEVWKKEGQGE